MKKKFTSTLLIFISILGSSAFITKSSNGITGYAGSPGEGTCSSCHGGGSSSASGITITATPAFSVNINSETEYMPDSVYQISIAVEATGFTHYGFASQILNNANTNAGTFQNLGAGVKFLGPTNKRSMVHTTPKIGSSGQAVTFTYNWKAPSGGNATIYAIANAVNGNNSTSGDFVISPVSLNLVAAPTLPIDPVSAGIEKTIFESVSAVSIYPNPANSLSTMSFYLNESRLITIELIDIRGTAIKELHNQQQEAGSHSLLLNLNGAASGVYFIRTLADRQKVSQKLITIQ